MSTWHISASGIRRYTFDLCAERIDVTGDSREGVRVARGGTARCLSLAAWELAALPDPAA